MYGIPHGWGANVLMWSTDKVDARRPTPGASVFDANSPYKGKITAYDSPIYIADAALYLMATKPDLKITNPYALDQTSSTRRSTCSRQQNALIGEYWADYAKEVAGVRERRRRWSAPTGRSSSTCINADKKVAGRGDRAQGGLDRLVGHLDDRRQGQAPELHVQVDGLDHLAEGERPGRRVVR